MEGRGYHNIPAFSSKSNGIIAHKLINKEERSCHSCVCHYHIVLKSCEVSSHDMKFNQEQKTHEQSTEELSFLTHYHIMENPERNFNLTSVSKE